MTRFWSLILVLMGVWMGAGCVRTESARELKTSGNRLVGGSPVEAQDPLASSLVGIFLRKSAVDVEVCTGSFLTDRIILTAAHCVPNDPETEQIEVYRTTDLIDENLRGEAFAVATYLRHENYSKEMSYRNDLALILLEEPPSGVRSVDFEPLQGSQPVSWKYLAVGFGRTTGVAGNFEGVGVLRRREMLGLFYESTLPYFRSRSSLEAAICSGDSGGPALIETPEGGYRILGVASYSEGLGAENNCDNSSLHMNVAYYHPWIVSGMEKLLAPKGGTSR